MKIILLENIDMLGNAGDIVTVKDGYARNYLLPKNKAKPASPGNMKISESLKKKEIEEATRKRDAAKMLADRISTLSLTINVEAGEEEKLFGSVSNATIQDALLEKGINIDKKDIILDEPIKKLGVYQVAVKVHPEMKASLRVWVVKK